MVFLKLVHTESQVNHKTQPFWVKVGYLVPNVQTLAGHAVGTIHLTPFISTQSNGWCQQHAQLGFEHWVLDGPPLPKWLGFVIYLILRMHQLQKYHLSKY